MQYQSKSRHLTLLGTVICAVFLFVGFVFNQQEVQSQNSIDDSLIPLDSSFTYQGFLEDGGTAVDDTCDFRFTLYDAATGGSTIGAVNTQTLDVDDGVFSTKLNFGNVFYRNRRWLSIDVRCPAGSGSYSTLTPRAEITGSPLSNAMPNISVDPTSGHIGINNNTFPYAYGLDVNDTIRSKYGVYATTTSGGVRAVLDSGTYGGRVTVQSGSGVVRSAMGVLSDSGGYVQTLGANTNSNITLTSLNGHANNGYFSVNNSAGSERGRMVVASNGSGYSEVKGPNGDSNVRLTYLSSNANYGFVSVDNSSGSTRAQVSVGSGGYGYLGTSGPNGNGNFFVSTLNGYNNNGYAGVRDSGGTTEAGMYVNSSGQGVLFADVKNFSMENPQNENTRIWYASLEGPEAGAYTRGTAQLVNGQATITLPDHFLSVASEEGLTVQLTPLSADSLGLAVVEKALDGIVVQELHGGTGNYEFDFLVTAVRQGYEDYEVVRPVTNELSAATANANEGIMEATGADVVEDGE